MMPGTSAMARTNVSVLGAVLSLPCLNWISLITGISLPFSLVAGTRPRRRAGGRGTMPRRSPRRRFVCPFQRGNRENVERRAEENARGVFFLPLEAAARGLGRLRAADGAHVGDHSERFERLYRF